MTQRLAVLAGFMALLGVAAPALAQLQAEPWRAPVPAETSGRTEVTSDASATAPSAAEQREARTLAVAIFARPAAAERAAEKAAPTPDLAAAPPKPEWTQRDGPQVGGGGLQVSTPF